MEYVAVLDENGEVIGKASREEVHEKGLLHPIAAVYVINDAGQILIQVRADNGKVDHSAAGHVAYEETPEEAAYKELAEEVGITDQSLSEIGRVTSEVKAANSHRRHLAVVFQCNANSVGEIDENEVAEVRWVDPAEIQHELDMFSEAELETKYTETFRATFPIFYSRL